MRGKYENKFQKVGDRDGEEQMWSIWTEPKFGIGQRCVFVQTDHGNVLWDCMTNLDEETVNFIKQKEGLKAIVISHPHYYTTHLEWAQVFDCPVYLASNDKEWISREDQRGCRRFIEGTSQQIIPGVTAIKVGGHFPGSLVLLWNKKLLIADSFVTTPVCPLARASARQVVLTMIAVGFVSC